MHYNFRRRPARVRAVALGATVAFVLLANTACAPGPDAPAGDSEGSQVQFTKPVTAEDVAALGDVKLRALGDTIQKPFLDKMVQEFEQKYPNVTVDISYRSFEDLISTVVNVAASDNPPDLFEGNNGQAVDGALVKARLVRPLDDLAQIYGWTSGPVADALSPARWDKQGQNFGSGSLYGLSAVAEVSSIYYNADKLKELGLEPPTNIDELVSAAERAKDSGELPIQVGNTEQWPATHLFSYIAAGKSDPADIRAWISGTQGSTFATEANMDSIEELKRWADEDLINDDFNSLTNDEAVKRFADGDGVFFVGGSWNGINLQGHPNLHAAPLLSGGSGGLSQAWHISSTSDNTVAAAAFLAMMQDERTAQMIQDSGLLPLFTDGVQPRDQLGQEMLTNLRQTLEVGTQIGYYDWSTPDMYQVLGQSTQSAIAGEITAQDFVNTVQAAWEETYAP